jgi:hypothetical protein
LNSKLADTQKANKIKKKSSKTPRKPKKGKNSVATAITIG